MIAVLVLVLLGTMLLQDGPGCGRIPRPDSDGLTGAAQRRMLVWLRREVRGWLALPGGALTTGRIHISPL